MKKLLLIFMILFFPFNIYAYSNRIAVGGETIGIEVHSKGVYVVGFYEVDNKYIGQDAGFKIGDIITKINDEEVVNINSLNNVSADGDIYTFTVLRNGKEHSIKMQLIDDNNSLRTGLYVKDQINGIGTLSYVDPETKVYGSLGHEIIESASYSKFNVSGGKIYKAIVSSIKKSVNGQAGEKNASIDTNTNYGVVDKNEESGIFGIYDNSLDDREILDVGKIYDIHKGKAFIRTVIEEERIEEFDINILNIDENASTKNIFFEITDEKLINRTGGIVQGMSGSPIIQDNKIIGVVNYVVVDDTKKGYGIFITTMLEEGDKILS